MAAAATGRAGQCGTAADPPCSAGFEGRFGALPVSRGQGVTGPDRPEGAAFYEGMTAMPERPFFRAEDRDILTGQAVYGSDLRFDGLAHAVFVRSPHAHAGIVKVDVARAKAAKGVLAVLTFRDFADYGVLTSLAPFPNPDGSAVEAPAMHPLAGEVARYVGEPVVVIVASRLELARDAADLVDIEFEELPAAIDARASARDEAPRADPSRASNIVATYALGDRAEVDRILAAGHEVVRLSVRNQRLVPAPMEPRVATASFDAASGVFTLYAALQAAHLARNHLADDFLRQPRDRLRVVVPRLGGGFGGRLPLYREEAALLVAARLTGRPVRWTADRTELFLSDYHARDHDCDMEAAFAPDGRILGLRTRDFVNLGAYASFFGIPINTSTGNRIVDGPYHIPATDLQVDCVLTNTVPIGPYRGAGRPEVVFRLERLMDVAARRLGLDPVEIRRRNLVPHALIPFCNNAGQVYDSGNFEAVLDMAIGAADWDGFAARRQASATRGKLRGRGLCYHIDTTSGMDPSETVVIRPGPGGVFTMLSGTQEMGQSLTMTYCGLAAGILGVPAQRFTVVQGDTAQVEGGEGSYGSRSLFIGGSAVRAAATTLRNKILEWAARNRACDPAALRLDADGISGLPGGRAIPWDDAFGSETFLELEARESFSAGFTFPNGCYIVEVDIDRGTGHVRVDRVIAVDDVGTVINPTVVRGQIVGGIAQGLGQALLEEASYDPATGQLVAGSFLDYAMPRASDMPDFAVLEDQRWPTPNNPLGAKGAGESGAVGAPPAIVAAVMDALSDFGVEDIPMPLTAEKIWRAMTGV